MKKIINNKVYDTDTAVRVARWDNGDNDLNQIAENLYRKKTGEYFLHGSGGANTRYAQPAGTNWWGSGERIMPMTYAAASDWAQQHMDADAYETAFGAVVEDDSRKAVTYTLPVAAIETLRRRAEQDGVTITDLLTRLIMG